jgi:endonuclease YncB( thermonuclease family)
MKKVLICITILLPISTFTYASEFTGRCVSVTDGDTVKVMREGHEVKIRLWGIDAPEMSQPFGKEAKQFTQSLVLGKTVKVVIRDQLKLDLPQGKLYLDKTYINLEIIKACLAWYYDWLAPDAPDLESAEKEAEKKKCGLWKDPDPIPPWKWRSGWRSNKVIFPGKGNVFITRGSKKYHRISCEYVKHRRIQLTVQIAKSLGYTPCEVCKPEKE